MAKGLKGIKGARNYADQNGMRQARYWICTVPRDSWEPKLPDGAKYCRGQPEIGEERGYRHWQFVCYFASKKSLRQVREVLPGDGHYEPCKGKAAEEYVWKEATRDGEQFEFGERSFRRDSSTDWARVKELAKKGEIDKVPDDIFIRYYRTLRTIAADYESPVGIVRQCFVFFGATGTGKSMSAYADAGEGAYPKDPRTKFWCGYKGERAVVIDEFRGGIDISHMLRWLDRYPVRVEVKGGSRVLMAEKIWITSNLHPMNWYPELDSETKSALMRRLEIKEFV